MDYRYRIIFLAQDLFDRCLLEKYEENETNQNRNSKTAKDNEKKNNISDNMDILAYVCVYIATKYFLAELSPSITDIFPNLDINVEKLSNIEKIVLNKYLKYRIYKRTIYDLQPLDNLSKDKVELLFDVRYKGTPIIGKRDIKDLLNTFLEELTIE